MNIILYIVIGFVVGALLIGLILMIKLSKTRSLLEVEKIRHEGALADVTELQEKLSQTIEELRTTDAQLDAVNVDLERARTLLESEREHHSVQQEQRQEQFEQQLKTVQEQFSNLATKVLNSTSDRLKTENSSAMENITKPLQENLNKLSEALERTNTNTAKQSASLSEQLKAMAEQTLRVDESATRLTNVLRGGNQVQGQWGERILTDILDAQGFRLGEDYDVQQTLTDEHGNTLKNDESGSKMRPDVIIHYPNEEDVIIDSKMSIDAYYQYVNTQDDTLRRQYANQLVRSIRNQMTGLAKKDYSSYVHPPRRAIDFVVMFVPNEGALQLALLTDPKLWGEAFERHIFLTSQQNLMAMLKIVQMAWRQYAQTESQKHVYELADELLKRLGHFMQLFESLRKDIASLGHHYDDAYKKVFEGRQSISQKANELKSLGAKENSKYPIPETIITNNEE